MRNAFHLDIHDAFPANSHDMSSSQLPSSSTRDLYSPSLWPTLLLQLVSDHVPPADHFSNFEDTVSFEAL